MAAWRDFLPNHHWYGLCRSTEIKFQRDSRHAVVDDCFVHIGLADHLSHHLVHHRRFAGTRLMIGWIDHKRGDEHRRLVVVSYGFIP